MLCVWPLAHWGPEKQNLSSDCPIFFISFHLFPPKNEVSTFKLCSERVSNMAGHRQKHILLLRGKECNVNNKKKKKRIPGIYEGRLMSRLTSVSSYDTAIQGVKKDSPSST